MKYGKIWLCLLDVVHVPRVPALQPELGDLVFMYFHDVILPIREPLPAAPDPHNQGTGPHRGNDEMLKLGLHHNAVCAATCTTLRQATADVGISISLVGKERDAKILWLCRWGRMSVKAHCVSC